MADRALLSRALRRVRRGSTLSTAVVVVATGALLAAALDAEGYETPELELHDAGIWLSRADTGDIGRANTQIEEVDVRIDLGVGTFDLLQHDSVVWVHDPAGTLCSVDGRSAKVTASIAIPETARVDLNGPSGGAATGALLANGQLWVEPDDGLLGIGLPAAPTCQKQAEAAEEDEGGVGSAEEPAELPPPDQEVPEATELVVGVDGIAWTYSPQTGELLGFDASGAPAAQHQVPELPSNVDVQLSVVGSTPVVLDLDSRELLLPGADPVSLDDDDLGGQPQLQLAGPARDVVLLGTSRGLVEVPLGGGPPELVAEAGTGDAARPLYLRGCAYGAWSGGPSYAVDCAGREPVLGELSIEAKGKPLQIRTNRGKVMINDLENGYGFLISEGTADPISWDDAVIDPKDDSDDESDATTRRPEDAEEQEPPEAVDDTGAKPGEEAFATRPGRAVVVHPMRNDHDPNKDDVLVIQGLEDLSGCECLELVHGALAVQVTPPAGSDHDIRFRYTIDDGQASDTAEALVEIHGEDENEPPYFADEQTTTVVSGGTVTHNVLADARDPDGDALSLVLPVAPPASDGSQGTLTAAVDGTISYTAPGGSESDPYTGTVTLPFTITDGRDGGELSTALTINVISPEEATHPPVARGDHAQAVVGHEVVVDVLANDSDADGDVLRVTHPGSSDTAKVIKDDQDRIHVTPTVPGPLILTYSISDGSSDEVSGKLRIDVLEDAGPQPPVAVRDDVILPAGEVAVADVLRNDTDANGDVLIVEGVRDAEQVGLAVEVLEHRFLRIRANRALERPVSFTYSVTDGLAGDSATVVVRPGAATEPQPPTAADDSYRVRVGTIAALDVLANDTDPEGGALQIVRDSVAVPEAMEGNVFVQNGTLRFAAPATPPATPIPLSYTAMDPTGRTDSAEVLVTVIGDDERNDPPQPLEVTARTVAGVPVVIPIPVATIDPNGDDVTLLGLGTEANAAPKHGAITEVGTDRLTYRPDRWDGGFYGTDTFTYRVRDARGLEALAVVRVGVAAPPQENHPPVAIEDRRQASEAGLTIDVLRNDSDPDGDDLHLVADSLVKTQEDAPYSVTATDDGRVQFEPEGLGDGEAATFTYKVTDGILTSLGRVTVTITDELPVPPIALDDRHPATEAGEQVEIDVLANDVDPDGARDELTIDGIDIVEGLDALPDATNPLRFTMPAHDVVLRYRIVDADDQRAEAVVRVRHAAAERAYPPTAAYDEATTDEGVPVTVDVLANDQVTPGREKVLLQVVSRDQGTCTATSDGQVRFEPEDGFAGWGGCSYVLGDGPGDASDTLRATGSVGVLVERTSNSPPRFVTQRIRLFADTERDVDLRPAVVDPDDPEQRERVELGDPEGATDGVSASIDGTVLHLAAESDVVDGEVELTFTVSDGTDESAEPGKVIVEVSKYDGPLAALANDEIEALQGAAADPLNVLANDTRAIADNALKVVDVSPPPADEGTVEFKPDGEVRFTPVGDFHGLTSFTYTVDDGTGQVERYQTATVTVTVIGFPDPPAPPSLVRFDSAIGLSWSAPADNGAPIDKYIIEASDGTRQETSATSFRFEGLDNGTPYTFRIAAVNRAVRETGGEPSFSVPSKSIVPDVVPDTPAAPTATFDPAGKAIDVVWAAPPSNGSAIDKYVIKVDPAPSSGDPLIERPASPTEFKVEGLTNGVEYTFSIQAWKTVRDDTGAEELHSEFSAPSVPEIPAMAPEAPTKPTINPADLGDRNITVHWTEPWTNGDAISAYHVEYFVDGASAGTQTVPGTELQTTIQNTDNGKHYTFRVVAENKAGKSEPSALSDPVNSYGVPGPVGAISATEGDRSSVLTFQRPDENGATIDQYQFRTIVNGSPGSWTSVGHSMTGTTVKINVSNVLTNGTTYRFQVRAHNARDWATDPGQESNPVRPFGKPFAPSGLRGSQSSTTLTWDWNGLSAAARNGHDGITDYQVSINGGGWKSASGSTSHQEMVSAGQCRSLRVRAIGNRVVSDGLNRHIGSASGSVQACAPAPPPPPKTEWVLTANTTTCPERNFDSTPNYRSSDATCGHDGAGGFIFVGTSQTFVCDAGPQSGYLTGHWLRLKDGRYAYGPHFDGDRSGMPNC